MKNYRVAALIGHVYIDGSKYEANYSIHFEEVDDGKAKLFGVYQVNNDGTADWIADFYRREDAELFARVKAKQ
jgi:hypothetical protein